VFGAEAQQLFCESFHVAVKFKRERRKSVAFPASAGPPSSARRLSARLTSWVVLLVGF
jgi:hypothetical protein